MPDDRAVPDSIEISPRFRQSILDRIQRLEQDADADEAQVALLTNSDHIRRQMRLVAVERAEALRMRLFLERSGVRVPRSIIAF
ncbi:MAG TPA: hypothetical protein VFU55_02055 [Terracidiphilus sp.]|nr:hypothetical protein [Terracidiphilus sp.]